MEFLNAPVMPETLDAINDDSFTQAQFKSSTSSKLPSDKVVINLASQTISVPAVKVSADASEDEVFHKNV